MSEAATPAVAAGNRVSTTRIVGGAGVALAASVAVQNAVFVGTGAPAFGDPLGEVLAYHAENRGAVAVAVGQEAVNLPLLLLFVTGLHGLVQRRGGAGADWSGPETSPSRMARHCCSSGLRASLRGSSGSLSPAYGSSVDRADVALWWRSLKRKKATVLEVKGLGDEDTS